MPDEIALLLRACLYRSGRQRPGFCVLDKADEERNDYLIFLKTELLFGILYTNHFCGGLCGGGEYILVRKVNGVWRIVYQPDTWMS